LFADPEIGLLELADGLGRKLNAECHACDESSRQPFGAERPCLL
jgi:hypothetical protein